MSKSFSLPYINILFLKTYLKFTRMCVQLTFCRNIFFEEYIKMFNERNKEENEKQKHQQEEQDSMQSKYIPKMPNFNSFNPNNFKPGSMPKI